ncbi:MAG: hypothetical protein ACYCXW_02765, partial [Solirubrobacteraceae bacterium]
MGALAVVDDALVGTDDEVVLDRGVVELAPAAPVDVRTAARAMLVRCVELPPAPQDASVRHAQ